MNKPQLVKALMERTKAPKAVAEDFLDALFGTISEELKKGDKVMLGNFGTFYLVRHKDRTTSHPTSKEAITLPALTLAKFRPSTKLKEMVNRKKAA
jgi:DNA-binding protein HU-beta